MVNVLAYIAAGAATVSGLALFAVAVVGAVKEKEWLPAAGVAFAGSCITASGIGFAVLTYAGR